MSLIDHGYLKPESILKRKRVPCGLASFDSYLAIDPDGLLIKCCESMGHPEQAVVGDVLKGPDIMKMMLWKEPTTNPKCYDCRYLPICLGGCKASQFKFTSNTCFEYKDQVDDLIKIIYVNKKKQN